MKPQFVAAELGKRLPANAIVNCDSGTIATWWARHIPVKRGQMHTISGNLATMACGLALHHRVAGRLPGPPVRGLRRRRRLHHADGRVRHRGEVQAADQDRDREEQQPRARSSGSRWSFSGNPEYGCDLAPIDFAAFARACGGTGFTIEDPAGMRPIARPGVRDARSGGDRGVVDPNEPPMPAKVTAKQAAHFAEALAKGTPDGHKIIEDHPDRQGARTRVRLWRTIGRLPIDRLEVSAFTVPTSFAGSRRHAGMERDDDRHCRARGAAGVRGLGYGYADVATATLIDRTLKKVVLNQERQLASRRLGSQWSTPFATLGGRASASMAIAAVDNALWDLKAQHSAKCRW